MKILSAKTYGIKLKATIQATGKLGFPKNTSDVLGFETRKYIKFAQGDDDDKELYLIVSESENEDAFKLSISSGYYSLNTKGLFDALDLDYKNKTIIFDLQRIVSLDNELEGDVYKMVYREILKTDKSMES